MTKKFIITFLGGILMGLSCIIMINSIVDPTGFLRVSKLKNSSYCDGADTVLIPEAKSGLLFGQIDQIDPQTVLIGTSRMRYGFGEADIQQFYHAGSAFNSGAGAMSLGLMAALATGLTKKNTVQNFIIGLDYGLFIQPNNRSISQPFFTKNDNETLAFLTSVYRALLTLEATRASLGALLSGCDPYAPNMRGFVSPRGAVYSFDASTLEALKAAWVTRNYPERGRGDYRKPLAAFMRSLEATCRLDRKIDLFIEPGHALINELIAEQGDWSDLESWKRAITKDVARLADKGCTISITDFSGYNHVTTAPYGAKDTPNIFYLDFTHFKANVGQKILRRLGGYGPKKPEDSFGVVLTRESVEQQITAIRQEQTRYRAATP